MYMFFRFLFYDLLPKNIIEPNQVVWYQWLPTWTLKWPLVCLKKNSCHRYVNDVWICKHREQSQNWTKPSILVSMTSLVDPKTIIGLFPKGLLLLICVDMWDLYLSISWNYLNTLVGTTCLVCLLYSLFYPLIQPIGHLFSCLHLLVPKSVQWKYIC
jgi:hypothetical protein